MPTLYCYCGASNHYSSAKPTRCSKCGKSFLSLSSGASGPKKKKVKIVMPGTKKVEAKKEEPEIGPEDVEEFIEEELFQEDEFDEDMFVDTRISAGRNVMSIQDVAGTTSSDPIPRAERGAYKGLSRKDAVNKILDRMKPIGKGRRS